MKFSFKIILLICFGFISFEISAQQNTGTVTVTDDPSTSPTIIINNQDDIGRDEVDLVPTGTGGEVHLLPQQGTDVVHLHVDPSIIIPASYQSANGTSSGGSGASLRTLNPGLSVGSTAGSYNVNQCGGLGYTIPITLPPGTNGIKPSLSISYNSFGSNNLVGYGWGISGVSSIDRNKMDFYHNVANNQQYQTPLNFTSSDLLTLDGNALTMLTGPQTAPVLYSTENDLSIRVTPVYSSGLPSSFIVQTKDGLTMEYGNTADSKFIPNGQTNILSWKVNKISDNYGNYILFQYHNQNGQQYIEKILYTGTANISPYNEINFYYDNRQDKNFSFIQGGEVDKNVILREIEIKSEGTLVKQFNFNYTLNNNQSFLNEIVEEGALGGSYNSMLFSYDNDANSSPQLQQVPFASEVYTGDNPDYYHVYNHVTLDFDGDGDADIMTLGSIRDNVRGQSTYTKWSILVNDGTGNFTTFDLGGLTAFPFSSLGSFNMLKADINGDGLDDVIFIPNPVSGFLYWLSNGVANSGNNALNGAFVNYTQDINPYDITQNALILDFNGDGITDLINPYKSTSGNTSINVNYSFQGGNSIVVNFNSLYDFSNATILDIDGDGKQEIVNIKKGSSNYILMQDYSNPSNTNGLVFILDNSGYSYNPFNYKPEFSYAYYPTPDVPYDFYGDFNGDAKSDVLNYNAGVWTLNIGKGDGTYLQSTPTAALPSNLAPFGFNPISLDPFIIKDINSDGKSDIVFFLNGINNSSFDVYYSTGTDFIYEAQTSSSTSIATNAYEVEDGDFNGDGNPDFISFNEDNTNYGAITYFFKGVQSKHLNQVIDGYNNATTFQFQPLSSPSTSGFYKQNAAQVQTYPFVNLKAPIYAVSNVTSPDGIGGTITTNYTYQDAIYHLKGLDFLGFNTVAAYNTVSQVQTISTYSTLINSTNSSIARSIISQQTNTLTVGNSPFLVSQTDYTPSLFAINSADLRHFVGITKKVSADYTGATTTTTYTYDNSATSPTNNNVTQIITDISGVETQTVINTYDTYQDFLSTPSRVVTCTTAVNRQGQTTPYQRITSYTYNDQGDVTLIKQDPGKAKEVDVASMYYSTGNLNVSITSSTDGVAKTKTSTYTYDSKFRYLASYQNPNPTPQITQYTYDNKWGQPLSVTGFDNLTTTYVYDEFGKNTQVTTPDGLTSAISYDWVSPSDYASWSDPINVIPNVLTKITSTRPGSPTTTNFYDVLNRNVKTITDGFNNPASVVMAYDVLGNLTQQSNAYDGGLTPLLTTLTYDNLARLNNVMLTDNNSGQNTEACTYQYNAGSTTVTSNINAISSNPKILVKTFDATGLLTSSVDNYATLNYVYGNQHSPIEIDLGSGSANPAITNYIYDNDYGTLTSQNEKNTGLTGYTYNAYGQLITQSDNSNNHIYTYTYDELDRITNVSCPMDGTYIYDYVPLGTAGVNQLHQVSGPTYDYIYSYDALNRPITKTEHIGSETFITSLEYDTYNNISKITYPSSFAVTKHYDTHGYLNQINRADNGNTNVIWQTNTINAFGNYSAYTLGANINVQKTYTNFGFESNYTAKVGTNFMQNYDFNFDPLTGNLSSRTDHTHGTPNNLSETFTYDKLDRLKTVNGSSSLAMEYYDNGNIQSKSDIGTYSYDATKINALTGVTDPNGVISQNTQTVDYNAFNKATILKEKDVANPSNIINELDYTYGPDQQRRKASLFDINGPINTTYYQANYEKIKPASNPAAFTEINYIIGGDGICAMYVNDQTGSGNLYYVFKDYLGSILKLTDANGTTIAEQSFDAWGRKRNPDDWTSYVLPTSPTPPAWLIRGYTGHEHLPQFFLVNMNGRMYDPTNARMLSADNNVQDGENTQNYNRYSYCLNNPLKYTDPTGYDCEGEDFYEDYYSDGPITPFQSFINGIVNFITGQPNAKSFAGSNNKWGSNDASGQAAQNELDLSEFEGQSDAAFAGSVDPTSFAYYEINFSGATELNDESTQAQIIGQINSIFSTNGVHIAWGQNQTNQGGPNGQLVIFGSWDPNAVSATPPGGDAYGATYGTGSGDNDVSKINTFNFKGNYPGLFNDRNAGNSNPGKIFTLKLANTIAHEILHGFVSRAISSGQSIGGYKLDAGGHINNPVNLLTEGDLRKGRSSMNDNWIKSSPANNIIGPIGSAINNYINGK